MMLGQSSLDRTWKTATIAMNKSSKFARGISTVGSHGAPAPAAEAVDGAFASAPAVAFAPVGAAVTMYARGIGTPVA